MPERQIEREIPLAVEDGALADWSLPKFRVYQKLPHLQAEVLADHLVSVAKAVPKTRHGIGDKFSEVSRLTCPL
jgi:hypothetical protein